MYAIVACGVFRGEIERIRQGLGVDLAVTYLDPGLHVSFDELEAALTADLERHRGTKTIVAFGACHPRMNEILKPYGAVLLDCQNCIDAFITGAEVERRAASGRLLLPSLLDGSSAGVRSSRAWAGASTRRAWRWAASRGRYS